MSKIITIIQNGARFAMKRLDRILAAVSSFGLTSYIYATTALAGTLPDASTLESALESGSGSGSTAATSIQQKIEGLANNLKPIILALAALMLLIGILLMVGTAWSKKHRFIGIGLLAMVLVSIFVYANLNTIIGWFMG